MQKVWLNCPNTWDSTRDGRHDPQSVMKILKEGSCFLYPLNADLLDLKSKLRSTPLNSAQVMHTSYVLCMQLQNKRELMTTWSGNLNILKCEEAVVFILWTSLEFFKWTDLTSVPHAFTLTQSKLIDGLMVHLFSLRFEHHKQVHFTYLCIYCVSS